MTFDDLDDGAELLTGTIGLARLVRDVEQGGGVPARDAPVAHRRTSGVWDGWCRFKKRVWYVEIIEPLRNVNLYHSRRKSGKVTPRVTADGPGLPEAA